MLDCKKTYTRVTVIEKRPKLTSSGQQDRIYNFFQYQRPSILSVYFAKCIFIGFYKDTSPANAGNIPYSIINYAFINIPMYVVV